MNTAIVTGASSGIGSAITKELLLLGFEVFGFGRDFELFLSQLSSNPAYAKCKENFHAVSIDLTRTGYLAETVKQIKKQHAISLLINNAGAGYFGLHEEISPAMLHEMVTVNLEVPMLLCGLLLRDLKQNQGQIIFISSITAKKSSPHGCAYGASKAGLTAFSESLFDEARKYGVKVTCIHPDMTQSNFYRNADFKEFPNFDTCLFPEDIADLIRMLVTARDGFSFSDITIMPQKHRIEKK